MRIMLVHQHFPPAFIGGSERNVQSLARELTKLGDQVSIVARHPAKTPPTPITIRERLPDDSRLYRLTGGQFAIASFLQHHQHLEREFTAAMLKQKPDVVHFHHLGSLSPGFVEIAAKLGAAVVISLHDFYFACPTAHLQKRNGDICAGPDGGRECAKACFAHESNPIARWGTRAEYYRLILSLAGRVVCHSTYVASYFETFGLPRSRLRILPIGIPPANEKTLATLQRDRHSISIAFCGSVIRLKGPHVILQALDLTDLRTVRVTLFGPMPDKAYVAELKNLARIIPGLNLQFHGAYNWSELSDLLSDVDCVVSPSLVPETFGMVPREALVHGIPVVVSRLGALPEIVRNGENGFTFDPGNPRELADIFVRLTRERDLPTKLKRGALATRIETPAGHAQSIQAVYREAVDPAANRGLDQEALLAAIHQKYLALLKIGFE